MLLCSGSVLLSASIFSTLANFVRSSNLAVPGATRTTPAGARRRDLQERKHLPGCSEWLEICLAGARASACCAGSRRSVGALFAAPSLAISLWAHVSSGDRRPGEMRRSSERTRRGRRISSRSCPLSLPACFWSRDALVAEMKKRTGTDNSPELTCAPCVARYLAGKLYWLSARERRH